MRYELTDYEWAAIRPNQATRGAACERPTCSERHLLGLEIGRRGAMCPRALVVYKAARRARDEARRLRTFVARALVRPITTRGFWRGRGNPAAGAATAITAGGFAVSCAVLLAPLKDVFA